MDYLTFLAGDADLRKRHTWDDETGWSTRNYGRTFKHRIRRVPVESISQVHQALEESMRLPNVCVIRGDLRESLDGCERRWRLNEEGWVVDAETAEPWEICRKLHEPEEFKNWRERAWFMAADRQWVALDLDDLPSGLTPEEARKRMPRPFQTAACRWQFSGSQGVKSGTRLHLWFWLSRKVCGSSLKDWLSRYPEIDGSLFSPVHIHYVAAPEFVGAPDLVLERSGFLDGKAAVEVPSFVVDLKTYHEQRQQTQKRVAQKRKSSAEAIERLTSRGKRIDVHKIGWNAAASSVAKSVGRLISAPVGTRHRTVYTAGFQIGLRSEVLEVDLALAEMDAAIEKSLSRDRWSSEKRTLRDAFAAGRRLHCKPEAIDEVSADLRGMEFLAMDDVRKRLRQAVKKALSESGRVVLASGTGTGKSTIIRQALEPEIVGWADTVAGSATVSVPTRALAREWCDSLTGAHGLRPTRAKLQDEEEGKYTCGRIGEYMAALRLDEGAEKTLCEMCPSNDAFRCSYIAARERYDRGDIMVVTHAYSARTQDWREVCVVDENPLDSVLDESTITLDQLDTALVYDDLITNDADRLRDLAWGEPVDLSEVTLEWSGTNHAARKKRILASDSVDEKRADTIAGWEEMKALSEASSRGWAGVWGGEGEIHVPIRRDLGIPEDSCLIAADATCTPNIARLIYGRNVQFVAADVELAAKVVQFSHTLSNMSVHNGDWRTKKDARAFSALVELGRLRCERPLFVLTKKILAMRPVQSLLKPEIADGRVTHFRSSSSRGANRWVESGAPIDGIVLVDWHVTGAAVKARAQRFELLAQGREELDGVDWRAEAHWQSRDAEIIQTVGRLRASDKRLDRGKLTVILASGTVFESLGCDEVIDPLASHAERIARHCADNGVFCPAFDSEAPKLEVRDRFQDIFEALELTVWDVTTERGDCKAVTKAVFGPEAIAEFVRKRGAREVFAVERNQGTLGADSKSVTFV